MDANAIEDLIQFYSTRFSIPSDLSKEQMMAESSGRPEAVSKDGARGLFQMMPETASDLLFQPEVNIMVSRFYLKQLFDGMRPIKAATLSALNQWKLALAAYNAGPATVAYARGRAANPDDYDSVAGNLPDAAQSYVEKVWSGFMAGTTVQG